MANLMLVAFVIAEVYVFTQTYGHMDIWQTDKAPLTRLVILRSLWDLPRVIYVLQVSSIV